MKSNSLNVSDLASSLGDGVVDNTKISTPAVRRQKSTRLSTGNTLKKMVLGTQRIFHHEIVEVGSVERRTSVFGLNERNQDLLNEYGVADILPDIKKNKRNDFEVFARKDGNNFELADGSRRRRACVLGNAALLLWVCDDLTDKEMEYLSDSGNKHKQASVYERGIVFVRWLEEGRYTSSADISRSRGIHRRTVDRCLHAAKLPEFIVEAYRSPNDMSVESAGKLWDIISKNKIDLELLKRRSDGCKTQWSSQGYSGSEMTKRLTAPVLDVSKETAKKKTNWLIKDKVKMTRTKTGLCYELPELTEDQETEMNNFMKKLLKK